jgi:hypothetical protein
VLFSVIAMLILRIMFAMFAATWIISIGVIRGCWAVFNEVCKMVDELINRIFEGLV